MVPSTVYSPTTEKKDQAGVGNYRTLPPNIRNVESGPKQARISSIMLYERMSMSKTGKGTCL